MNILLDCYFVFSITLASMVHSTTLSEYGCYQVEDYC